MAAHESKEQINAALADRINPKDPATFVFDPADYQLYTDENAVVSFAWITGQLGIVVWNLAPGQWNDYHMHPTTEHLHLVLRGEVEYHLADLDPITVPAGRAVIVPARVPHGVHNVTGEPASYIAVTSPGPYEKVLVDRPTAGNGDSA
jgi:quercetin dioxygenase-like cupin family protein